jgi:hypothetical protein
MRRLLGSNRLIELCQPSVQHRLDFSASAQREGSVYCSHDFEAEE